MATDSYGTPYANTYGSTDTAPTAGTPVTYQKPDGTPGQGTWMGYVAK